MTTEPTPCPDCGHPTLSRTPWINQPKPRTARPRTRDGRCRWCYQGGTRRTHPRMPRAVALEEWRFLHEAGELNPRDPQAQRIRQAAPRLGVSYSALERALLRAKRDGQLERAA